MGFLEMTGAIYLLIFALYTIAAGIHDGQSLSKNSKKYHLSGWFANALCAMACAPAWFWVPLMAAYFWLTFDVSRNVSAGDPILFVGSTAFLDKTFGNKIIYVKIVLLISSIVFLILKYNLL